MHNINEEKMKADDIGGVFSAASELRNTATGWGNIFKSVRQDKISAEDLHKMWAKTGNSQDSDVIMELLKKAGFGNEEINKVFSQVLGNSSNNSGAGVSPGNSQIITKIAEYAKKNNIADELIEYMREEFGDELGLNKTSFGDKIRGVGQKMKDFGKKIFHEDVRQIFAMIAEEDRVNSTEYIRRDEYKRLGRNKK